MRITQSMLSNNLLRNVSNSYNKLGKLQDQIASQKKINRPSDDPVVAMLGIGYRGDLNQVKQFDRNISEVNNWLDSTENALMEANNVMQRIRELTTQASNGSYDGNQRKAIAVEIEQLQNQIQSVAQTQVGDKYIFNGTNTNTAPEDGVFSSGTVHIEVFNGIKIDVNTSGQEVFEELLADTGPLSELINKLNDETTTDDEIASYLDKLDEKSDFIFQELANVGAKQNRVELMENRIAQQEVTATSILSENEDVDMEKVITEFITQQSIHRAALSVGAQIIQPTLVDFIR